MTVRRTTLAVTVIATLWLLSAARITASDELTRARTLYNAAAYDDALTVLNAMTVVSAEAEEVNQYRVLCLVALDRRDDAKQAMKVLIEASPLYRLPEEETAPRVRAMFAEVRKSVLPGLAQRAYADAKAAFDRKDPGATERFDRVLVMLRDPDVAADPALADLVTVATGFRDLSKAASSPPPVAESTPAAAPRRPAVPATTGVIVPPIALSQPFPPLQLREAREWDGEVELVIDAAGKVASARMTKSIHPQYDAALLRAARDWTYKPATRDGVPTQMVKTVTVHLDSRPSCGPRVRVDCRPVSP